MEQEIQARYRRCEAVCAVGDQLINNRHYAQRDIKMRINSLREKWSKLQDLAAKRRSRLEDAYESHQVMIVKSLVLFAIIACMYTQ